MLVLTRKVGEQINIGDEIVVRVIEVSRGNVKIGIDAPASVSIYRQEVYEKIQEQNVQASRGIRTDLENAADFFRNKASKERKIDS
jgi:carbon storage regulator